MNKNRFFTVVYEVPDDWRPGDDIMHNPMMTAVSWSHALHDRDAALARAGSAAPAGQQAEPIGYVERAQLEWLGRSTSDTASVQLWRARAPIDAVAVYLAAPVSAAPAAPTGCELCNSEYGFSCDGKSGQCGAAPTAAEGPSALDYRAQGREEALQIIMAQSSEDPFADCIGFSRSGAPEDEGGTYWDEDKLRALLHIGDRTHDAYGRAETAYWEALGRKDEAERMMRMVESAPLFKPLHDYLAKQADPAAWELMRELQTSAPLPTKEGSGELDAKDAGALEIACAVNKKLGDVLLGRAYLLPDDLDALKRFEECASDFDSGGHDVPKPAMARLREIGVIQSIGFGRHQTTSFGDYVLERAAGEPVNLPLVTLAERNATAAIAAQPKDTTDTRRNA